MTPWHEIRRGGAEAGRKRGVYHLESFRLRVNSAPPRLRVEILAALFLLTLPAPAQQPDAFAAIALDPAPVRRGGVSEKKPPALPNIVLESARDNSSVTLPRRTVIDSVPAYRAALADLKKQYAPFLRDLVPPAPSTRAVHKLDTFQFRYEDDADRRDFSRVLRGEGQWQTVRIPDYRGPVGAWAGYYRAVFRAPDAVRKHETQVLRFGAVDYRCQVYLNGRMVGTHTGLFAPFEIDLTPYLLPADNVLVVRVENDFSMLGGNSWKAPDVTGDKIYAAVGPGWNEPVTGWHHCPPGAGIWQAVVLEGRPKLAIRDIFVRPDPAGRAIEARVEVWQPEKINRPLTLTVSLFPANFQGPAVENIPVEVAPAGPGANEYRFRLHTGDLRQWTPDTPWLYTLRARVAPEDGPADVRQARFGVRTFSIDETSDTKGTLLLNGEPVILRGANTMGNFQRPVMEGNLDQAIDDILIAKLAHMNFIRLTQTPVQPEVYDLCDRLGLMLQTDLPLFGYLRRGTLEEAVKQAGEMERLIRNHPSSIMISYINEPFSPESRKTAHRNHSRVELERFFDAASAVVRVYNPDRAIKPIEGDYDPPSPGLPDNHIYCTWYGSHGVPIGKFIRGYWISNKDGWKHGSGEYGVEGLDVAATMFKNYPKDWLPASVDAKWSPLSIPSAQTGTMHFGWFDAQDTMRQWIEASQRHQAWGVRAMTRAFRRQSDRIVTTAVHLLIDAWPSGWMKSLVDVDRNPKPAYFEFREALTPLLVDLRADRLRYYSGENLQVELWVANDRRAAWPAGELVWELWRGGERIFAQSAPASIPSYGAAFQGYFRPVAPKVSKRETFRVRAGLKGPGGTVVHDTTLEVEVFPPPRANSRLKIGVVGREGGRAWKLAQSLGATPILFAPDAKLALVDSPEALDPLRAALSAWVSKGGVALFLEQPTGTVWNPGADPVRVAALRSVEFVSRKTGHPLVAAAQPFDFAWWYDPDKDYFEYLATTYLDGPHLVPILISGVPATAGDPNPKPRTVVVAAERRHGQGTMIFSQIRASERTKVEPPARAYFQSIIDRLPK
jgi:hypothetical protein